jgi:ABC-type thiamine transport system ATPase subunit
MRRVRLQRFPLADDTGAVLDVEADTGVYTLVFLGDPSASERFVRRLCGLEPTPSGVLEVDGGDGALRPPASRGIAVVWPRGGLWPHLELQAQLAWGLAARGTAREERERWVREVASRLGLESRLGARPEACTESERVRAGVARALLHRPSLVVLDHALEGVDEGRDDLEAWIGGALAQAGCVALYVSSTVSGTPAAADRVLLVEQGVVVHDGSRSALVGSPPTLGVARDLEEWLVLPDESGGARAWPVASLSIEAIRPTIWGEVVGLQRSGSAELVVVRIGERPVRVAAGASRGLTAGRRVGITGEEARMIRFDAAGVRRPDEAGARVMPPAAGTVAA